MAKSVKILSQIELIKLTSSGNSEAKKELEKRLKDMVNSDEKHKKGKS
ncbi:hypothetical protein H17ap60334_01416 [Thermosipho africanus H17ap60334]|uniref:Uncharacterized protein n=2 Tax=Thermosipho TaxID=2420 RepID=A0A841GSR5_9BACT|nr:MULTISPECIES: hypothetical protein [Thermosipho]MDK2840051.1 hypothetical protein [Thermosipho sp. (in: thermotogales)]ACJ75377.1 conserved hypothetical protein [Thermosipho africanus TCF52B]EKF50152.1 hypothetical protein H17ap60334_01416 [Thermosipho africanus H17ap60334]MBB6062849.1 hypothetical protein [Thermosipho japonicus]RDI90059.1 hypothetical protein Ob7_09807 [Thermosipho africanus Ob7]